MTTTPFESAERKNGRRKYFMISLHESHIAKLGFKVGTTGSAVQSINDCAMGSYGAPLETE